MKAGSIHEMFTQKEKRGAHIYYSFNEKQKYMNQARDFLSYGLTYGYKIIFIDEQSVYQEVMNQLSDLYPSETFKDIYFYECEEFYFSNYRFDASRNSAQLSAIVGPLLENGERVMTWGQVTYENHEELLEELRMYEINCDLFINTKGLISVCAYNGLTTAAYIQIELLKTHEYFMTDDDFSTSTMYHEKHLKNLTEIERNRLISIEVENENLVMNNKRLAKANKLIARKRSEYRKLLQEIPVALLITKGETLCYANVEAMQDLVLSEIDFKKNKRIFDVLHIQDKEVEKEWMRVLHSNIDMTIKEVNVTLHTGQKKTYRLKSIPTWYGGEEASIHTFIDLTQSKEYENHLIRSEKLNIAGQIAAGIAHEIKNPLTSIKGFYHLIKTGLVKDHFYKIIDDELDRIEQIANEFLILAKPHLEANSIHAIDQIIEEVKTLLETQAIMKGIEITTTYDDSPLLVDCEETKIKQLFVNLIKNSLEAMNHGHIEIKVKKREDDVEVKVIDDGHGISADDLRKINEPFFTTKKAGTGLGLLICDKIINSHGGSKCIESEEGVGTTYTVRFPLVQDTLSPEYH
ncbi:ATP-binding protein [Alkalihalophilus lindianensis]|uniref:histidine kinase n=1 Tax=Alkalihalophilus lindianensis TaxID=1630542 RepID=A0ABU3X4M1_9BACI|nr:ATP-binding protein [Alkalihalophilus lindianensis]MDV2682831.1 ATP-binding protein [Alkalihalophilus lindianensis]